MRPSPQPSRFVHYLSHSSQTNKQATNKPTTAMSTINNTNYSPSGHNDYLWCVMCDKDIVRDSDDHDHCVLVNKGYDLICQDCPRKCKTECGECVVCEDPSESESEDELEGDCCAGATDPRIVITYTMAGGGSHWWNYEVHYGADGEQEAVYINNKNGKEYQRGERLFHHEEHPDQLRIEARDFEQKDWHEMVHYA